MSLVKLTLANQSLKDSTVVFERSQFHYCDAEPEAAE